MRSLFKTIGRSRLAAASVGALAMATVSSVAWAAIPSTSGEIDGCYDNQSGQVRLVDTEGGTPKGCGRNETAISWQQEGLQGDPGPRGPGIEEAQASTLTAGSAATAELEPIPADPEGDQRLLLGIPQGAAGSPGSGGSAFSGYEVVEGVQDDESGFKEVVVSCTPGKKAIGGWYAFPPNLQVEVNRSLPNPGGGSWIVRAFRPGAPTPWSLVVAAICVDAS